MPSMRSLLSFSAAALAPTLAAAVSVDLGASNLNGNAVADHSSAGTLSFDVQVQTAAPIELVIHMDPGEDQVAWNGYFERPTDLAFLTGYQVTLTGATLGQGSVRESLARDVTNVVLSGGDTVAQIGFAEVESAFAVGAAPNQLPAGASDWQVATPTPGASFNMTLTPLPEPGPAAAGAGLLALWALRARRRAPRQRVA